MSNDRYNEDQLNGYNGPTHSSPMPTMAEYALMQMSSDERREYIDKLEHAGAKSDYDAKEARIQAEVAAATERSLAGNHWYQAQQRGLNNQRVTVQNGKTTVEQLNRPTGNLTGHDFTARQVLVDQLNVWVGGMELGPQQAKEMMQRGEISEKAYYSAVDKALEPYGYRSFR